ncbi:MAG: amidase [Betaproteobacteria bacterium]|nr:MAG: amidase [Betaproteobacteria bacterium]
MGVRGLTCRSATGSAFSVATSAGNRSAEHAGCRSAERADPASIRAGFDSGTGTASSGSGKAVSRQSSYSSGDHGNDPVGLVQQCAAAGPVVPGTTIEQIKKLRTDFPGRGPHTLTGPVYIEGAEPGDVLKVRINKIVPRAYATNFNVPGMFGEFPSKFPEGQVKYFYLDLERKVAEFAPGIEIPLAPFPGTIGVARAESGQYSSVPPGRYGGNMDVRDLTEGATLYVPVFVKGALLWTGDSHAAQGNGEINLTALETAYKEMNVTVDVLKNMKLEWPRIETKDSWITVGIDRDLNKALDILQEETRTFLMEQRKLTKDEAAKVMMATWDCRVTQVVDVNKGLHCFSAKNTKERRKIEALPEKENKSYLVTVGRDADLNKAMDDAAWAMIGLLEQDKKLTRLDAYSLASMVMDCRLAAPGATQKAVHCLVPKSTWVASR